MGQKANEKQEEAINYPLKPVLIEAGPGAGKTYVLIKRIKYLLECKKVKPESLLVITFTIKAADELKRRLSSEDNIPSEDLSKMFIGTIHSFCNHLLMEYSVNDIKLLESEDINERKVLFLQKNFDKLGFNGYNHIDKWEVDTIISKYDQFTNFGIRDVELVDYLEKNYTVSEDYKSFVEDYMEKYDVFPKDSVRDNEDYYNSWYFAKFIALVKSYKKYIGLLKENKLSDFSFLQVYAKELLSENNESLAKNLPYKNILIDEFQDIDPIQKDIFEMLKKYSDSFTVVGDDDQSIYGFRGSFSDNFVEFGKENDTVELNVNYRSGTNIIDFNECFIKDYRSNEKNLVAGRSIESNVYYMLGDNGNDSDYNSEAENIALLIKSLKDENKVDNYSDIGLLFRGMQGFGNLKKPVTDILSRLDEYDIPYNIPESSSLTDYEEVQVMMTLLWYMKRSSSRTYYSKTEREWLNLRVFSELKDCLNLSEDTCKILSDIEDKFEEDVIEAEFNHENRLYKRGRAKNLKSMYSKYHSEKATALFNEILNSVPHFQLNEKTRTDLMNIGITDEHDLDLFEKLYNYRKTFYESSDEDRDSLLTVYYKLLEISGLLNGIFDENSKENDRILNNLAKFTQTISNYMELVDEEDLNGLIWFILSNYENYSSHDEKTGLEDEVQLLTIHKAKGLEFPVVIVCSLVNNDFPFKEITRESLDELSGRERGRPTYPIKPDFFKYKNYDDEKEIELEDLEEKHVFYVACTRAKQLLVLSTVCDREGNKPEFIEELEKSTSLSEISSDDFGKVSKLITQKDKEKRERIDMSYTSFSAYNKCPRMYNLGYNYQFRLQASKVINDGLAAHTILERMNKEVIQGSSIDKEDIIKISKEVLETYPDIEEEKFIPALEGINNYWNNYLDSDWEVIGSEVPFNIIKENYDIQGKIDLILKNANNEIKIVDYKTTNKKNLISRKNTHEEQLCIYAKALENYNEYNEYEIKYASVYSLYDNYELEIDLTREKIDMVSESLNETVKNILNNEYCGHDKKQCDKCPYYSILCKNS